MPTLNLNHKRFLFWIAGNAGDEIFSCCIMSQSVSRGWGFLATVGKVCEHVRLPVTGLFVFDLAEELVLGLGLGIKVLGLRIFGVLGLRLRV